MNLNVVNKECRVGNIHIIGVASSAVFIIGDTQTISTASAFDSPPESVSIGLVPFAPEAPS